MPHINYHNRRYEITEIQTLIGASESCHISIPHQDLDATHALIEVVSGGLWISGINRLSAVFVNAKRIRRCALNHLDVITLGSVQLSYSLFDAPHSLQQDSIQEKLSAYQRLYEFSQRIAESQRSSELFEVILEELVSLTKADQGLLVSVQGSSRYIRSMVDRLNPDGPNEESARISESVVEQVCSTRQPILQNDLLNEGAFTSSESIIELGLCSVMCTPLIFQGELLGVIYVGSRRPVFTFTSEDLRALYIFGAQAATLLKFTLIQEGLQDANSRLREELEEYHFGDLIGASSVMREVYRNIERVSRADISVFISGETGTGKELIAREIHRRSDRSQAPFIAINCGAIPATLIESELFGYKRGAFTGATSDKAGRLVSAHGGTLFLDEIGEMPMELQVRLLRVLESREVKPLGSNTSIPINIRLICATNRSLKDEIKRGQFRADLYYRINVVEISLPPLRERGEDIVLIAKYLVNRYIKRYEQGHKVLSREAQRGIRRYAWPGNIRELENRIAQAVILSEGSQISLEDLNLSSEVYEGTLLSLHEARERFTKEYVSHVIALNEGNRTQAARDLNVDPRTIFRYLQKINED